MSYNLSKTLVLVGLMGAGKTAIGTILAEQLDVPFVDSDDEIVKAANMSIAEIFERDGEAFFRDKESLVIERLLTGAPMVLSTGGGAFMQKRNRELIEHAGISVWLRADLGLLWDRVKDKNTRPLLKGGNPRQILSDLLDERTPIYDQAQIHVKARRNQTKEAMVSRVIQTILDDPSGCLTQEVQK